MKLGIVSYTGKIGKSTICNTLAFPRMPGASIIRLETINESGISGAEDEAKFKGRDLAKLETQLAKTLDAIVDVGASNVESFLLALNSQYEAHLALDYFLVPVKANAHAQIEMQEAIKTIKALAMMEIAPDRIKVVFNMLPHDADVHEECKIIFNMHKKEPIFTLNPEAVIHESEAFSCLTTVKRSYTEMLADPRNYRAEQSAIPIEKEKERTELVKWIRAQGTVKMIEREMHTTWNALFNEAA
jgi:hypothetical protein